MVEAHKKCIICGHDFKIKGKPKPLTIMVGDVPVCESCKSVSDFENVGTTSINGNQRAQLKEEEDKDKADRADKIERQRKADEEGDTRHSSWY
tara:strand:+ start:445 stop:723 length:279 start_codon:yes stop_codon:yes gene_type:complete